MALVALHRPHHPLPGRPVLSRRRPAAAGGALPRLDHHRSRSERGRGSPSRARRETTSPSALESRAAGVLAVAADRGHRRLVLGAWGCGVFRNDPRQVADVFATWLEGPGFADAFDHVVFAVFDRSISQSTLRAFQARLAG
ncbi:MAG TPA: TIGR02452 family protein [Candidatus Dormibacteraeota bacterium]|nr:TIGR02452 family protein [Candidatus Dormibacteraeota bacterium]